MSSPKPLRSQQGLWSLLLVVLLALCVGGGLTAQDPVNEEQPAAHSQDGHGTSDVGEMAIGDLFKRNFVHLLPHPISHATAAEARGVPLAFYDVNLYQLIAVVLILLIFTVVKGSFHSGGGGFFIRVFRGWVHWLRDLVVDAMGEEDGKRFAPYFCFLFFFIAFMNLIGLVPKQVTATATFWVTGGLALVTFVMMLGYGMAQQGVAGYFKNLLPHGLPIALIPLMAVVELIGLLVKPFALMVRLFANMLAGHMVIYSFLGMIFLFAKMFEFNVLASIGTAIPAVGMAVFINIIEAFISLLQAYIFTYLSILFVHQAMHPAH